MPSDSINEQRCEHGKTEAHPWNPEGTYSNGPARLCPGPSVVAPPAQDEQTPDELVELASEASLRIDALNAQARVTLNGDRCTHDSSSGDEGAVSDLVGPVVRWRCDGCGDVWYDDQALTSLRTEIIARLEVAALQARIDAVRVAVLEAERIRPDIGPSHDPKRREQIIGRTAMNAVIRLVVAALGVDPQKETQQ